MTIEQTRDEVDRLGARMVSSACAALKTASLLVAGAEREEGPLRW